MSCSSEIEREAPRSAGARRLQARVLRARDRDRALALLRTDGRHNLVLVDVAASLGESPRSGEQAVQLVGAWDGRDLVSLASLRPSLALDANMSDTALAAVASHVQTVASGLLKSPRGVVDRCWEQMHRRGRRTLLDRIEIAYAIDAAPPDVQLPVGARWRAALDSDLDFLVHAARASLREENRPDPFTGDPNGFRRWVRGRVPRARVVEMGDEIVFVAYADVRRPDGWLVQGVYTWPHVRRRGLAAAGMAALVREALEGGAEHVQLAVVEGNEAATRLYEGLGFRSFVELRTILFV